MSQSKNNVYLDFSDLNQTLSYESFHDDDAQVLEVPAPGNSICLRVDLVEPATLSFAFTGQATASIKLDAGSHQLPLADEAVGSANELKISIRVNGCLSYQRHYKLVRNYGLEYTAFMFRLYQNRQNATAETQAPDLSSAALAGPWSTAYKPFFDPAEGGQALLQA